MIVCIYNGSMLDFVWTIEN